MMSIHSIRSGAGALDDEAHFCQRGVTRSVHSLASRVTTTIKHTATAQTLCESRETKPSNSDYRFRKHAVA
jgi:hypothetical protein